MTRGFTRTTTWLLALTAGVALLATVGPLHTLARSIYPEITAHPDVTFVGLLVHNAAIAFIPAILVLVRWHTHPQWQKAGDLLITIVLAAQAIAIGLGIGAWPHIIRHLPNLPFELAALAAAAQIWRSADERRIALRWTATTAALLAAAAVLEVAGAVA